MQAGYDHAFGSEGANNYLGITLSYALSTSTSDHAFDVNSQKRSIDSIYSNAIEIPIYNSYVSDECWYNDTITKFSYLMSDFKINNLDDPNNITSTTNDTKNFALTLSDEVGYKFALGESKEWGYHPSTWASLDITTKATSNKPCKTLEHFYNPMPIRFKTNQIPQETANNLSNLQSDGRIVVEIGSNISIQDHTRIYFDFEKSFVGKITTDYQVNVGVRYSFGENTDMNHKWKIPTIKSLLK